MATDKSFIDWILGEVDAAGVVAHKKMFGEYMVYCDAKPVLLVCDNTPFVKILPETTELFLQRGISPDKGFPYDGAREHYILDIDNRDLAVEMLRLLARILPMPKPKKKPKDSYKL